MVRSGHGAPAGFRVYDFDRCSGQISKAVDVVIPEEESYVDWACFSPNSRYLYLTNQVSRLYQYDTWASDISASVQLIGEYDGFLADYNVPTTMFTMTLAPDQRIYMSANNGVRYLHTIHRPDEPGPACDFRQHDFVMHALFPFFLPNMPNYRLYNEPGSVCDTLGVQPPIVAQWYSEPDSMAGPTTLTLTDISYFQPTYWHWSFGDGDTSLLQSPAHAFPSAGEYNVCLIACNEAGLCDTLCRTIQVIEAVGTPTLEPESAFEARLWPNPARQQAWLGHEGLASGMFVLSNMSGQPVYQRGISPTKGVDRIELGNLPGGIYFWQIRSVNGTVKNGKLLIQR
ncbi:MAG: T9SS type A sorting domain-containing protein [Saprospiraceae bacterium]|nr:T9SS type A sorting domain-containing protein [Saprospiraceae bacterium]